MYSESNRVRRKSPEQLSRFSLAQLLTRFLSGVMLCAIFALATFAQSNSQKAPAGDNRVRRDVVPASIEKRQVGMAGVEYNVSANRTVVFTEVPLVQNERLSDFMLNVSFDGAGKKIIAPQSVRLVITAERKRSPFGGVRKLVVSADKNELDLTTLKKQSYVFLGMTRHVIGTEMSFADFSRIAKSENVEIRVGPNTFRFIEGHKQAMRDILSTIESK